MLKLLSRQALKALRNPFRSPLPNPLRGPLQTRYLHNVPAPPFSGPPSYATIARRFSALSPDPINFFRLKEAKEAMERGQFIDIHDIGRVDLNDYDVLLTDINNDTLHSEISKLVDVPYLKEATKDEADKEARKIHGFLYGQRLRMIFPCVLSIKGVARWVFFIVDSGAPVTYISAEVAEAFGLKQSEIVPIRAKIAGYTHLVYLSPEKTHFSNINLLNMDFCSSVGFLARIVAGDQAVTYYIGNDWDVSDVKPKPKL